MILAGDVGGTKTLLGLFRRVDGYLKTIREDSLASAAYPSLVAMVTEFLARGRQTVHACAVGVAGPVVDGRSQVVNLAWPVDAARLARTLTLPRVALLNDLEATAWGIPELPARKFRNLTPGLRARKGTAGVIAAGTGLGTATLFWDGSRYHPVAGEGGHQNWGPGDDTGADLWAWLRTRYGRASLERVVSGPAFSDIYQFLVDTGRGRVSKEMARRFATADDRNAVISAAGVAGEDAVAERAVDLFVGFYGAAAGDLALVLGAVGGVYVAGGIAPRILPKLEAGGFVQAFRDKGRLRPFAEKIPVRVVLEPRTALLGAAACAARMKKTTRSPAHSRARR